MCDVCSGLAILEHKPFHRPLCVCPSAAARSTHQTSHSTADHPPKHSSTPAQHRAHLSSNTAPPARKERAPKPLVADRDPHCSLTAQERTASTETRAKRGRLGPPTPYSSSCSGSQRSCFQPLSRLHARALASTRPKTPTRPHPRAHPHRHSTIAPLTSTVARRPQLRSRARASTRAICARIVQTSSRASASVPAQAFTLRISQAPRHTPLTATAAGRAQRHTRVISDTRDRTIRLPEHYCATLQDPGTVATGWDAGSFACNNIHVQWSLVQSTQQH